MSDVFISYSSEDREYARRVADSLARVGWSVWWDRTVLPGQVFDEVIAEALEEARCVVVLWSRASVESDWVIGEADYARKLRRLVPAKIEPVELPLAFARIQTASLVDWGGSDEHEGYLQVKAGIASVIQGDPPPGVGVPQHSEDSGPPQESRQSGIAPARRRSRPVRPIPTAIWVFIAALAGIGVVVGVLLVFEGDLDAAPSATQTPGVSTTIGSDSDPPSAVTVSSATTSQTAGSISGASKIMAFEAEDGKIEGSMSIGEDTTASNGQFVSSPTRDDGEVIFGPFSVEGGDYVVEACGAARGPSFTNSDSMYVSIDGGERRYFWDFFEDSAVKPADWACELVSARCGGTYDAHACNPLILELERGAHTPTFEAREPNFSLDTIELRSATTSD